MTLDNDKYIYSGKAATLLDVSSKTLAKWVEQGHLDCLRQGKNRKFSLQEIEKFQQSSFYRSRKPKYTLIYVRANNSFDRRNLVDKARRYCQQNSWTEIAVSEPSKDNDILNTHSFRQAFNYFYERKIERLICCESQDKACKVLSDLVRHRDLEVIDLLNL